MPKTVEDVRELLGISDDLVKAAYIARQLPGYVFSTGGGGDRYVMTDAAFERLERGDWEAKPRLIFANTNLVDALLEASIRLGEWERRRLQIDLLTIATRVIASDSYAHPWGELIFRQEESL